MTLHDRGDRRPAQQAHRLPAARLDEEHYARSSEGTTPGDRERSRSLRSGPGHLPTGNRRGAGSGLAGLIRFLLFVGVLAAIVLTVSLTVLRPVVARAVVGWAADNPSALRLPFVADLVREDLGTALTRPAGTDPSQPR